MMDEDVKIALGLTTALVVLFFAPIVREEWKKMHEPPYTAWTDKNRWE